MHYLNSHEIIFSLMTPLMDENVTQRLPTEGLETMGDEE